MHMAYATKKRKVVDIKLLIDDLPNELFNEIFKNLGIRTFIGCRLVNKRWKSIIDAYMTLYKVVEMVIYNNADDRCLREMKTTYFHTNEAYHADNEFRNKDLRFIRNIPLRLDCLTRLKLNGLLIFRRDNNITVDLSILNTLTALEHLELPVVYPEETTISLPQLRIFYISSTSSRSRITVDCPKLEIFGCQKDLERIYFVHIKSIKQLYLTTLPRNLDGFTNVKVFRTSNPNSLSIHLLVQLKNLQELHLEESKHVRIDYHTARRNINRIIEQKRIMNKNNVKIFFFNQLLENGKIKLVTIRSTSSFSTHMRNDDD